jgi:hypothetical protein
MCTSQLRAIVVSLPPADKNVYCAYRARAEISGFYASKDQIEALKAITEFPYSDISKEENILPVKLIQAYQIACIKCLNKLQMRV